MTMTTMMISSSITTKTITINMELKILSMTTLNLITKSINTIKVNRRDLLKSRPTLLVPITTSQDSLKTIIKALDTPQPVHSKFKTIAVEHPPMPNTEEVMINLDIK